MNAGVGAFAGVAVNNGKKNSLLRFVVSKTLRYDIQQWRRCVEGTIASAWKLPSPVVRVGSWRHLGCLSRHSRERELAFYAENRDSKSEQ